MRLDKKQEGFWRSSHGYATDIEKNYPMPVANVLKESEAKEIFDLIVKKQNGAQKNRYRGLSGSRITGELLGCVEYETDEWVWPGDFAEHYVLTHKVKPTDEFLTYIGFQK